MYDLDINFWKNYEWSGRSEISHDIYQSPWENNNIPKSLENISKNFPPFGFNQDPGVEYLPPVPNNPYYKRNQSNQYLIQQNGQDIFLNKIFENQNNIERNLENTRMEDKLEALKKENENLKHQQMLDNINNAKEVLEAKIENKNNAQQVQVINNIRN